jgi:hypothetical protein
VMVYDLRLRCLLKLHLLSSRVLSIHVELETGEYSTSCSIYVQTTTETVVFNK